MTDFDSQQGIVGRLRREAGAGTWLLGGGRRRSDVGKWAGCNGSERAEWLGLIREYEPAWHCFGVLGEAVRVASQLSSSLFVPKRPNSGPPNVAFIAPREDSRARGNLGSLLGGAIAKKSARHEFVAGFTNNDYTPSAVFTRSGEGYIAPREDSRARGNLGSLRGGAIVKKLARREFKAGFTNNVCSPSAIFTRSGEGYLAQIFRS